VLKGDEVERQTSTGGLIDGWMSCSCITATSSRLEVISHTDFIDHRHYHRENAARFHLYSDNNGTVGCFLSRVAASHSYRERDTGIVPVTRHFFAIAISFFSCLNTYLYVLYVVCAC